MASAAILAGGRASRFDGRDKSALVVGGRQACDMPFVTAELLGHLLSRAGHWDVVVPRTECGYHPLCALCAVYTRGCGRAVARRLAEGRLTMIGLFEELRVRVVPSEEVDAFGD